MDGEQRQLQPVGDPSLVIDIAQQLITCSLVFNCCALSLFLHPCTISATICISGPKMLREITPSIYSVSSSDGSSPLSVRTKQRSLYTQNRLNLSNF
jgi:hypothetical protein